MRPDWHSTFVYHEGELIWRSKRCGRTDTSKFVGSLDSSGYYSVSFKIRGKSKNYKLHTIIWEMFNGARTKDKCITHINKVKTDNRVENLREVTRSEIGLTNRKHKNNKSGFKGVHYRKDKKKYVAQTKVNGKTKYLGQFNTADAAHKAYLRAVCGS